MHIDVIIGINAKICWSCRGALHKIVELPKEMLHVASLSSE